MHLAFLVHNVKTPVSNAKIETPVRPARDSMEIMPDERNPHPETIHDFIVGVRHPVVIRIGKLAQSGNTCKESGVSFCKNRKTDPVEGLLKGIGEKRTIVGNSVAVPILKADQSVRGLRIPRAVALVRMFIVHGKTILDRASLEINHQDIALLQELQKSRSMPAADHTQLAVEWDQTVAAFQKTWARVFLGAEDVSEVE